MRSKTLYSIKYTGNYLDISPASWFNAFTLGFSPPTATTTGHSSSALEAAGIRTLNGEGKTPPASPPVLQ